MTLKRYATVAAFVLTLLLAVPLISVSAQESGGQAAGGQEGGATAASESPVPLDDPATIEAGKALFTGKLGCYGCHGQAGGGGMGPSLADATWIYGADEAAIHESITNGRPGGMPKFADAATDEEIWQVVAFVKSLSATK